MEIVVTGPSGSRMGKIHNMIEALKQAKFPVVAFADGDIRVNLETYARALETLVTGDAAFFPPYYGDPTNLGSSIIACYTNYYYFQNLAPMEIAGRLNFCSGGFMIFKRSTLEAIGGLERFATQISDDASIGRALAKAVSYTHLTLPTTPYV